MLYANAMRKGKRGDDVKSLIYWMNEKWPTLEDTEKTRAQLEAEGLDALIVPSFGGESDRRCPPEVCIADPGRVTILEYALAADAKKDRWMPIDRLALEDPATPP